MRKIVVLDGHTLNPGDLSWEALNAFGKVEVYPRTAGIDVIVRCRNAEIVLTNKTPLPSDVIAKLPKLRYIGVMATGYDKVDTTAARSQKVVVTNVPGYSTQSVAQHTWALLLELCQSVGAHSQATRGGQWANCDDWCFWNLPLTELAGLNLGVIGAGRIGRAVGEIAGAFKMNVRYVRSRSEKDEVDHVLSVSDVVTLHCPLTNKTRGIIDSHALKLMKATAYLINTSRGPLVDEVALVAALEAGTIAGAAIDVLSVEPPPANHPLLKARNCIVTPHQAWATVAARKRLLDGVIENIRAYDRGIPENVIN